MEFTENERLMLVRLKEEARDASKRLLEIIENINTFNTLEFNKVLMDIQSKISTLSSYSESKNYDISKIVQPISYMMIIGSMVEEDKKNRIENAKITLNRLKPMVFLYSASINSIEYDFNKKSFKINIRELIKIDSIFKLLTK